MMAALIKANSSDDTVNSQKLAFTGEVTRHGTDTASS